MICGQRRFPVEAARVMAWMRNAEGGGGQIAEVRYTVETTAEWETVWVVEWRDPAGAVVRKASVRYRGRGPGEWSAVVSRSVETTGGTRLGRRRRAPGAMRRPRFGRARKRRGFHGWRE